MHKAEEKLFGVPVQMINHISPLCNLRLFYFFVFWLVHKAAYARDLQERRKNYVYLRFAWKKISNKTQSYRLRSSVYK